MKASFFIFALLLTSSSAFAGPSVTVMFANPSPTASSAYVEACTTGNLYVGALNKYASHVYTVPAMYVHPGHSAFGAVGGKPGYGPVFGTVVYCEGKL